MSEAALVFSALWLATLVFLHLAPTGYSPLRNAVSEYGVGRFAWGYRAQVTFAALAGICLALALPAHDRREQVLLLAFAAARLAISFFPTDVLGSGQRTTTGVVHLLLAATAFIAICWCASALPREDGGEPILGRIAASGAVAMFVLRPVLGLLERVFYAAILAWFFLVAARLS